MKFRTARVFAAERRHVLDRLRDPGRIEEALRQVGVRAERAVDGSVLHWQCRVVWRDLIQDFTLTLSEPVEEHVTRMLVASAPATCTTDFTVRDERDGSRVEAVAHLVPRTLSARIGMQALSLARGKAEARLQGFITAIVGD